MNSKKKSTKYIWISKKRKKKSVSSQDSNHICNGTRKRRAVRVCDTRTRNNNYIVDGHREARRYMYCFVLCVLHGLRFQLFFFSLVRTFARSSSSLFRNIPLSLSVSMLFIPSCVFHLVNCLCAFAVLCVNKIARERAQSLCVPVVLGRRQANIKIHQRAPSNTILHCSLSLSGFDLGRSLAHPFNSVCTVHTAMRTHREKERLNVRLFDEQNPNQTLNVLS